MTWNRWKLIWCLLFHRSKTSYWPPRSQRCRKCGIYIRGPVAVGNHPDEADEIYENVVELRQA